MEVSVLSMYVRSYDPMANNQALLASQYQNTISIRNFATAENLLGCPESVLLQARLSQRCIFIQT